MLRWLVWLVWVVWPARDGLGNLLGQAVELLAGAFDGLPRLLALAAIHVGGGPRQAAFGPRGDGGCHLQIAQQFLGWRGGRWRMGRLPRLEKQPGLFQNPLPDRR